MPRAHPEEFRRDVVALARRHEMPMSQIAKDFGISESCLFRWVRQAEVDAGARPGVTTSESEEIARLKRENGELRRANEILKAASAFFAAELDRPQRRS